MVDLTPIITAVLTLIFSLITAFLIPYIKTKVSAEQFATIKLWVQVAVQAAEMLYVGSGRGEEKKKYVIEFLNSKGFTLNAEEIENLIESAVLELKQAEQK
ncbi:MAG: phage holin, LLH family [Gallintestinimicrobium sp.]|uniref:phage holin, LLH family n=1 Tax=Gallintestinimicrobium sp. TaxID=2981655 RepID=UPI0039940337